MRKYPFYLCLMAQVIFVHACSNASPHEKSNSQEATFSDVPGIAKNKVELTESIENIDLDGNIEKYQRKRSDFAKHGKYSKYGSNGNLIEESFFINDSLDGKRVLYYEKGDTQIIETYKMGAFEGPFRAFYSNGQLELEGSYVENTMHGKWKKYYQTGELMEVVTFSNNQENGPFVEYYPNGNLKAEGAYLEGSHEHGLLKLYDESGKLIKKMECEKGICKTIWKLE